MKASACWELTVEAIIHEQEKEWTPEQVHQYIKAWNRVIEKMVLRRADLQDILLVYRRSVEILMAMNKKHRSS